MITTYFAIKALQEQRLRSLQGDDTIIGLGPEQPEPRIPSLGVSKQGPGGIRKLAAAARQIVTAPP
ncbi:MAG TPA: hypothetical protein VJ935_05960 [Acidimicrobiia bacterium]|nr:hypothetical protein [Acidimicrobiia bacterium]